MAGPEELVSLRERGRVTANLPGNLSGREVTAEVRDEALRFFGVF